MSVCDRKLNPDPPPTGNLHHSSLPPHKPSSKEDWMVILSLEETFQIYWRADGVDSVEVDLFKRVAMATFGTNEILIIPVPPICRSCRFGAPVDAVGSQKGQRATGGGERAPLLRTLELRKEERLLLALALGESSRSCGRGYGATLLP